MTAEGLPEALFARLSGIANPGVGWYPLRLPDGCALPAGVYQRISSVPIPVHGDRVGLRPRRYQLTVYSSDYDSGLASIRLIRDALDGTRDVWDGWTVSAMLLDEAEDIDPDDRGLYRQRIDLLLKSEAP